MIFLYILEVSCFKWKETTEVTFYPPTRVSPIWIQARLELLAGVPGQIYTLVYPDGEELGADQRLVVNDNVLHGYVLK